MLLVDSVALWIRFSLFVPGSDELSTLFSDNDIKFLVEAKDPSIDEIENKLNSLIHKTLNEEEQKISDELINQLGKGVVFFANVKGESVNFICKCKDVSSNAGLLVKKASSLCNGRGGGSATFAQGGASNVENLDEVLAEILKDIKETK